MSNPTKVFEHPTLGSIRGSINVEGVTTFRNVKYADISYGRFTQSVLKKVLAPKGEVWDATKPGYLQSPKSSMRAQFR